MESSKEDRAYRFSPQIFQEHPELTAYQALILDMVNSRSKFFMSNKAISETLACSINTVSNAINKLKKLGLIRVEYKHNGLNVERRFIYPVDSRFTPEQEAEGALNYLNKLCGASEEYSFNRLETDSETLNIIAEMISVVGGNAQLVQLFKDTKKELEQQDPANYSEISPSEILKEVSKRTSQHFNREFDSNNNCSQIL